MAGSHFTHQVRIRGISESDSDTDTDSDVETVIARAAGTANSKAGPTEYTDLFNKISNGFTNNAKKGIQLRGLTS